MQGPKRYKAVTGRPQPRGCVLVFAVHWCLCRANRRVQTLVTPFACSAASRRLPPVARGVKILLDFLSKPLPPAVKV